MRILRACLPAIVCGLTAGLAGDAYAQQSDGPTRIASYRFLPRQSVLNEQGGIYPRDIDYRVHGTFDFVTGPTVTDSWGYTAEFDNVEAWAAHPMLAYVLDLNQVLNMEELKGRQLPVAAPFDVYQFEGTTQDGSSVNLYASVIGQWLQLRGGTTPPPDGADYLYYDLRATARQLPFADFDENSAVDAGDLSQWEAGFGMTSTAPDVSSFGDANDDQTVDGQDFLIWQRQLGEIPPEAAFDAAFSAALASQSAAVPEPGTAALLATAGLALTAGGLASAVRPRGHVVPA